MTGSDSKLPATVNLGDPDNVRYWCDVWKVPESDLRTAVEKVGVEATAVAFALGREAWTVEATGQR